MGRIDGKIAIITGAAGGIGRATTKRFVAEGASVLMVDLDEDALRHAADEIGTPDQIAIHAADVSKPDHVRNYVDACVSRFGGVDVLFANAGIEGTVGQLTDVSYDDFDRVQKVNLYGCWLALKYAAPKIAERGGGSIIFTSSVAGIVGASGLGPYVASKHAVVGLAQTAAIELANQNIRVNTVNPGPVANRMMDSIEKQSAPDDPESVHAGFEEKVPLRRYATNEEVANMVLFLASDESSYSTGSQFVIDGGYTAM
jgi:NAD(P)-dependent dehydrogenase (short-subunit alcohol dehydrogenase family)